MKSKIIFGLIATASFAAFIDPAFATERTVTEPGILVCSTLSNFKIINELRSRPDWPTVSKPRDCWSIRAGEKVMLLDQSGLYAHIAVNDGFWSEAWTAAEWLK